MVLRFTSVSVAVVVLAAGVLPAHAAGSYDGSWYVDAQATDQSQPAQEASGCEALSASPSRSRTIV
jgi:hypothetical protein